MTTNERSIERELKLAVPPRFRLSPLPVLDGVVPQADPPVRYSTDFFDSKDLALAAWGAVLRYRSGQGWQLKLPDTGDGLLTRTELAFAGQHGDAPDAAREILTAYLRGRPVGLSARTRTIRYRVGFVDERGAERLELVDDRVTIVEPDTGRRLRQLEIELRDPDALDLLDTLAERLGEAGATPDTRSKYLWALGDRSPAAEVVVPQLGPDAAIRDVVRAAIASAARQLIDSDVAIRAAIDPDAIHQARVATRRLRSHLRTFGGLLDPSWARALRTDVRRLGDALGRVRDTEVLTDRLCATAERLRTPEAIDGIVAVLRARLSIERAGLAAAMSGAPYLALLGRVVEAAAAPALTVDPEAPGLDELRPIVRRAWRRLRSSVERAGDQPADDDLHRVRIEAKRSRYAAEAIAPLAGKPAAAFARAATRLQEVLGEHQDAVLAWTWLHDAAQEGAIDMFTAGELAAFQLALRDDARARWRKAWNRAQRNRPGTW